MSVPNNDPDERLKPITFSRTDRDIILSLYTIDPEMEHRFKLAVVKGNGIVVEMNSYDLDELLGEIAAVANHEKNANLQRKLDGLFKRVTDKLEKEFPQ